MTLTEGQPFTLDYRMDVRGNARGQVDLSNDAATRFGQGDWDAAFLHTVMWGGITSVTDTLTGLPLENYTLTSASGIDYSVPMPEPSSGLLVAAAATMMLLRRRPR